MSKTGSIIIIGNPNVGKSTIFRKLCRKNIHVENYPDSSIELFYGKLNIENNTYKVIDIPGINSLFTNSEEELVAREIILNEKNSVLLQIADAKNIRRALTLSYELIELGMPMVLVLNMMDEALQKGIIIDTDKIENMLGVDVVMTIGNEGEGISDLKRSLVSPKVSTNYISYPDLIEKSIIQIQNLPHRNGYLNRAFALQLMAKNSDIFDYIKETFLSEKELAHVAQIVEKVNSKYNNNLELEIIQHRVKKAIDVETTSVKYLPIKKTTLSEKIGRYACHPVAGIPFLISILGILYLFVGKLGAEIVADFIQFDIFAKYIIPFTEKLLSLIPSQFVKDAFIGTYGIVSLGLTSSIGIVLPIIVAFFLAFSILEESGYLSRLGILLNSFFKKLGLNGKAVLPFFLGFSCVTMATMSTRILDTKKEKIIAILLLWLCIPCSAQLSIFVAILATISLKAVFIIIGTIGFQMIIIGYAAAKLIPGEGSEFFMEIYPIRLPNIKYTISKTILKVKHFFKEIIPLFLIGSFLLFILDRIKVLYYIELAGKPIVSGLLGLPTRMIEVFMLGFVRRDAGAAFFKSISDAEHLGEIQIIIAMVVMTLFIPCLTNFLVVVREHGLKIAVGLATFVTAFAFLIGSILNLILNMVY